MARSPPKKSRREVFVDRILHYAEDDSHGYSQKPPSGRWGPDYDCSSLLYQAADDAGYPVGTGSDKVRFTGTMLKDFEKAGFQILPFANVGISDLEIGDVLLNLALHAEVYVGDGESVGATASETGGFVGEAGDQTGREIERHPVTTFDKEWDYILRPPADDQDEEGDEEVPMYNQPGQGLNGMYSPTTVPNNPQGMMYPSGWPQGNNGYSQGMNRAMVPNSQMGYPQGNLGQMNGYSQANAGGYPQNSMMPMGPQGQQHMETDYCFVKGIEGARNSYGMPNSRKPLFDEDKCIFYATTYGPQGTPIDIHPYKFMDDFESMEEMPQHLSPLMQQTPMGNMQMPQQQAPATTREEIMQMIREVMHNESSTSSNESSQATTNAQRNANGSRGGSNRN